MKISEYINSSQNRLEARRNLARVLGKSEVSVRSWANGNRHPERKIWPKIVAATGGLVSIADLAE